MPAIQPDPAQVRRAIDVYLAAAYTGELPIRVRSQQKVLAAWKGRFMKCGVFVADAHSERLRYYIRLGNDFYPHMKLAIELSPAGDKFLFRVDTHDRHCVPDASTPEYVEIMKLVEQNQKLAEKIEIAMEAAGLQTFKSYLREDLQRRKAASAAK